MLLNNNLTLQLINPLFYSIFVFNRATFSNDIIAIIAQNPTAKTVNYVAIMSIVIRIHQIQMDFTV